MQIHFRLSYIITGFEFGDTQITITDPTPEKQISILLSKRLKEDNHPPRESGDGFIVVTCSREVTRRLYEEAIYSGKLSLNKEAVRSVKDDMYNLILHTLRLVVCPFNLFT